MLDELLAAGEGHLVGSRRTRHRDGWIAFHSADTAPLTLAPPTELEFTDVHRELMAALEPGGATSSANSSEARRSRMPKAALWELIWAGWVTGDTFGPVRTHLAGPGRRGGAHRSASTTAASDRYSIGHAQTPYLRSDCRGRWSALRPSSQPPR